jgi:broad specificity phosphatase PhoE
MAAGVGHSEKQIVFVRHGKTQSNQHENLNRFGTPGFRDPQLWDTFLCEEGILQADTARNSPDAIHFEGAELIVASPLRRALNTAEIIFANNSTIPRRVVASASERLYFSQDVGRRKSELEPLHPTFDFGELPEDDDWWYTRDGQCEEWRPHPHLAEYACPGEPPEIFKQRMDSLKVWLLGRPERKIVVVTHWGVIYALTGRRSPNCAIIPVSSSGLLSDYRVEYFDNDGHIYDSN